MRTLRILRRKKQSLAPGEVQQQRKSLYNASIHYWGSYKNAVIQAGIHYPALLKGPPKWTPEAILVELRRLHRQGADLSHNACKAANSSLIAGARRQFGGYRQAIEAAGISYAKVAKELQRSWDRQTVIDTIRRKFHRGHELSHNHVKKHDSTLFSAIGRHFGSYRAAIQAAGIAYAQVAEVPQQSWDQHRVIRKLRSLVRNGKRITHRTMGIKLHAAVTRYFGDIPTAVQAAGLRPERVANLPVRPWSKQQTLDELRKLAESGRRVIRANMSFRLYCNILRNFGGMAKAVKAAGLNYELVARFPWQSWNREKVLAELRKVVAVRRSITRSNLNPKLYSAVRQYLGGTIKARQALGLE